MRSLAVYENFLQMSYADSGLPPLWEIIYQEALRGNHLLFCHADVESFEAELRSLTLDEADLPDLESVVLKILSQADRQGMISIIKSLEYSRRKALYFLYKHSLALWRNFVLTNMN